jgi:hypothetical protein
MTSDDDDVPFEAQAAVAQGAWAFAGAFWVDRDMDAAWLRVDPLLRRCWAQAWLMPLLEQARSDGFDPDEIVESFATSEPDHPLWETFARTQERHANLPVSRDTWGMKVNPEPVAPDVELVRFLPKPDSGVIAPGETYASVPLLMRYEAGAGWRLLNFTSENIPTPGWPPAM